LLGPQAIPVVLAEKANPSEPASPFQPVQKIVLPLLAHREVLADAEIGPKPVNRALEILGALEPLGPGDDQTGGPRAGYARGGKLVAGMVSPASIPALSVLPVKPRQGPDLGFDRHPNLAGRIEAKQGVLGIGVVTALRGFVVGPAAGRLSG